MDDCLLSILADFNTNDFLNRLEGFIRILIRLYSNDCRLCRPRSYLIFVLKSFLTMVTLPDEVASIVRSSCLKQKL